MVCGERLRYERSGFRSSPAVQLETSVFFVTSFLISLLSFGVQSSFSTVHASVVSTEMIRSKPNHLGSCVGLGSVWKAYPSCI